MAVAVADGAAFCRLAGELRAFEAQFDAFVKGAGRYLAEFIVSGDAALLFIRAGAFGHLRALFTSDTAYAYFHLETPVLIYYRGPSLPYDCFWIMMFSLPRIGFDTFAASIL